MAARDTIDFGLFGPDTVTWRIHQDPSMLIGGLRALLIQALNPLAMAAVDQHSDFRGDPWGRLRRTSEFVTTSIFGDTPSALAAGRRVRAIHRRVSGVDPITGRAYRADDPELLLWVHSVEVHSFLTAYRRYGGRLSDDDADLYVSEMVRAAELVGLHPQDVPRTLVELRSYLRGITNLCVTPAAREGLRLLLNPPGPLPGRLAWTVPATAVVSILPRRVRDLYGLPWFEPAEPVVRLGVATLCRTLRILFPPPEPVRRALARAHSLSSSAAA
ncbi:MAG: oxygenase MpaB family protein [Actinomycetota bacterium]